MDKRILDCLENRQGDYILPFLWLHGETQERVKEEIIAIKNSGINQFCAESRPYEDFCLEKWWDDFGFVLKTAEELDMKVWLLDDKKFPTGYANGYLESAENAHLRKKLIRELQIEAIGPMKCAKLYVGGRMRKEEKIINVVAYRHIDDGEMLDCKTATDLTDLVNDDIIYWNVPEGVWRVCVTIETSPYEYENDRLFYYIDMLSPESCHAMIDAIYEPHYKHFKEYFGNTFLGFFSDEPAFLNVCGTYYNKLGEMFSPYPWRRDLPELIAENAKIDKEKVILYLPALWEDLGEVTAQIRASYMDVITKLYSESFSCMLGNWCRDHGVMYIGHVIEDMNAHMRMGYGSGHYFRALDGQDMAGIDVVLMQDIPGLSTCIHRAPLANGGIADPKFFRYTLPKLASSHSHIQPLKKGRAMCEIFGAFGWAEGLPFMKGLSDIMLASGINHFVPHAFSPTEEDTDCPPHFYNGGKNIQYPLFKNLMGYMGRVSHILSGGKHKCDVAVFYNAEGEWTGGKNQIFAEICAELTKNLIDFDIIPYDALMNSKVIDGKLKINGEEYGALIVSESEIMMSDRLACFDSLSKKGLSVIFTDSAPKASTSGDISAFANSFEVCPTKSLAEKLRQKSLCHVSGEGKGLENLRYYHIERDNKDIYLFSNENINGDIDAYLDLNGQGEYLIYEPWENKCYKSETENGRVNLKIEKGNMLFVILGDEIPTDIKKFTYEKEREKLDLLFDISIMEEGDEKYTKIAERSACFDISAPNKYPHFSGNVHYTAEFDKKDGFNVIDLGQVGEVCEMWLNDVYLGARINAPYKFSLEKALKDGKNKLEVVVKSNLAQKRRDCLSSYIQIPPTGILGEISLCKYVE